MQAPLMKFKEPTTPENHCAPGNWQARIKAHVVMVRHAASDISRVIRVNKADITL